MSDAPLSAQNSESGVVVEFVPAVALPSVPGGVRTVGLVGKGKVTKTTGAALTRGSTADGTDLLSPVAASLPSFITDENLNSYTLDLDYILSLAKSISASTPATTTTVADQIRLNINGDGLRTITLATSGTGAAVAADIQAKVRALVPNSQANAVAYSSFTCVYSTVYTLTSGYNPGGTIIVDGAFGIAASLKIGTANGGTETVGGHVSWSPSRAAYFLGSVDVASGANVSGMTFILYVNGGSAQTVTFTGVNPISRANIVTQLGALSDVTVTYDTAGPLEYIRISTTATNNALLQVGAGNSNTLLGFIGGLLTESPLEPAAGVNYSFSYETPKVAADYYPKFFSNHDALLAEYGDVSTAYTLSLASEIVFENSANTGGIVAVQLDPLDTPDLKGFQNALNKLAAVDNVNIVVPLTGDKNLYASIKSHVVNSSAPLEKKERTSIIGMNGNPSVATATSYAAGLAAGGNGRRLMLLYPPSAVRSVNGVDVTLDGSYIAAAVAGLRINANYDVAEPLLRKQLQGFTEIQTGLLRTDKLLLRNGGVCVIEMVDNAIRISEDTTVDRTNADSQEFAVTEIIDYVAKITRKLLENIFIGVKLLTDTPNLVVATVQTILDNFVALNILNSYENVRAVVNSLDPRQIDVSFKIQPVRTLRFIKVKFSI